MEFRSLDGLTLRGTFTESERAAGVAVLVHGGGVTRDEGGFFTRLADGLATVGISSLRFDLRGHGESDGRQEDLTLSGITNDIRAAVGQVSSEDDGAPANLLGTSFGGGITAFFAACYPQRVRRLVLLNPLLNYKKRLVEDKPYWYDDFIDEQAGQELAQQGFIAHSPTFKLGRPLLNEVFYVQPHRALGDVVAPTLFVHGTGDTFIPVESSREYMRHVKGGAQLIEVSGAQHGFAVHDDPEYRDPQTQQWQAAVIRSVAQWLAGPLSGGDG
jgi:pimeloyl-ACP methyl ester carboxylesterase